MEATSARTYDEVAATKVMIKRTEVRLGLKPIRLAADTAYGTGKFLDWLMKVGIGAVGSGSLGLRLAHDEALGKNSRHYL